MSYKTNFNALKLDIKSGKQIVLFLGAGVNYSTDVHLLWEDLINPLMQRSLIMLASDKGLNRQHVKDLYDVFDITKSDPNNNLQKERGYYDVKQQVAYDYSPQIKALLIKAILKKQYVASFQDAIYSKCNRTKLKKSFEESYRLNDGEVFKSTGKFYTLYSVARMILLNPNVKAVVTYNYDNFLTHAVEILQNNLNLYFSKDEQNFIIERRERIGVKKIRIIDIYGDSKPNFFESGSIFAYHPHGYIPSPNESDNISNIHIIMSLDEYCDDTTKVYSWNNDTQVHLLSHYTCIFIGSSISDLTTQRMLHYANKNGNKNSIYNLSASPTPNPQKYSARCDEIRDNLSIIHQMYLKQCGLVNIYYPNGFNALFNDFNKITSEYANDLLAHWHKIKGNELS